MRINRIFVVIYGVMFLGVNYSVFAAGQQMDGVDMHEIDYSYFEHVDKGITDSYGNVYSDNVLYFDASNNAYVSYDLNGEYDILTGSFVASVDTGSGAKMNAAIFADGVNVYNIKDYTRQQSKQEFEINLTGVKRLDIKTSNSGDYPYGWIFMVDSAFKQAATKKTVKDLHKLNECFVIDSKDYEYLDYLKLDSFGDPHDGALLIDASNNAYVLFNLNKQFSTLSGGFVAGDETGSGAKMNVRVYCDDKEVYTKTGVTRQTPQDDFVLDVTGVTVLKIETTNNGEYPYGRIYLVDDVLLSE